MPIRSYVIMNDDSTHWYFIFFHSDGKQAYESDYFLTRQECLEEASKYAKAHKDEA